MLFASLYALLGTSMGTCTMGSADGLELGGLGSAIGYAIGVPLLIARPPSARGWLWLAPVVALVACQTYLASSFFVAVHVHGLSACAWKEGIPEFEPDGRETWLTWLWVCVSAFGLLGLAAAWARGRGLRWVTPNL